jgi:hypothetical protein
VTGDRAEQYGDALKLHSKAVDIYRLICPEAIQMKVCIELPDTQRDALSMLYSLLALKLARHKHNPKRDNLVDACGYIHLIAEIEDSK